MTQNCQNKRDNTRILAAYDQADRAVAFPTVLLSNISIQ